MEMFYEKLMLKEGGVLKSVTDFRLRLLQLAWPTSHQLTNAIDCYRDVINNCESRNVNHAKHFIEINQNLMVVIDQLYLMQSTYLDYPQMSSKFCSLLYHWVNYIEGVVDEPRMLVDGDYETVANLNFQKRALRCCSKYIRCLITYNGDGHGT